MGFKASSCSLRDHSRLIHRAYNCPLLPTSSRPIQRDLTENHTTHKAIVDNRFKFTLRAAGELPSYCEIGAPCIWQRTLQRHLYFNWIFGPTVLFTDRCRFAMALSLSDHSTVTSWSLRSICCLCANFFAFLLFLK